MGWRLQVRFGNSRSADGQLISLRQHRAPDSKAHSLPSTANPTVLAILLCDQFFAPAQRHDPIAHPGDLSIPQSELPSQLRADRSDHALLPDDCVHSAAVRWILYGSSAATFLPRVGDGPDLGRADHSRVCRKFWNGSFGGGAGWNGLVHFPSGIVPRRVSRFGRSAWLCAINLSSRRQCWQFVRPASGRACRRALWAKKRSLVCTPCAAWDCGPLGRRELVRPRPNEAQICSLLDRRRGCPALASRPVRASRSGRAHFLEVLLPRQPNELLHFLHDGKIPSLDPGRAIPSLSFPFRCRASGPSSVDRLAIGSVASWSFGFRSLA